ncbi:peptidoglycan-binding domain-containing protein [Streptomyces erythrochromogenes]|uniref:peptidoglycan-binding domain-containing protein n=1 Tax=Streptomyces erythrochromogenes TaxID=285574 RepID=UPI003436B05D
MTELCPHCGAVALPQRDCYLCTGTPPRAGTTAETAHGHHSGPPGPDDRVRHTSHPPRHESPARGGHAPGRRASRPQLLAAAGAAAAVVAAVGAAALGHSGADDTAGQPVAAVSTPEKTEPPRPTANPAGTAPQPTPSTPPPSPSKPPKPRKASPTPSRTPTASSTSAPAPTGPARVRDTYLAYGMRGPEVADLQFRLRATGFYGGYVNGVYNDQLHRSVAAYQKARNIHSDLTGAYGPETRTVLTAESSGLPPS